MKKIIKNLVLVVVVTAVLFSCKKKDDPKPEKPQDPNEGELVTTVKLILTEQVSGDVLVFKFVDTDGPGGNSPVKDNIVLDANKTYSGRIVLLDETKSPVDSISNEVYKERDEHQFFFTVTSANLVVSYTDYDTHGVPVGLLPNLVTGNASTGTLKLVLKHQPSIKPTSGMGDSTKGETDVEVTFNVTLN